MDKGQRVRDENKNELHFSMVKSGQLFAATFLRMKFKNLKKFIEPFTVLSTFLGPGEKHRKIKGQK